MAAEKSEKSRRRQSEREKAKRARRLREKTCTRCGKNRPPAGRRQCGRCGEKNREHLALTRLRPRNLWGKRDEMRKRRKSGELFAEARRGELFGHHPNFVSVSIRPYVYNAISQRVSRLPSFNIELLVSSFKEIDELFRVMNRAVKDWMNGLIEAPQSDE